MEVRGEDSPAREGSMPRAAASFVCQTCGSVHAKWSGKCEACGGWNTIVEEGARLPVGAGGRQARPGRPFALEDLKPTDDAPPRRMTGIAEFDRVAAAGWSPARPCWSAAIPASANRLFILQVLADYARAGGHAIYISGEEAAAQVRLRAARMGLTTRRWRWDRHRGRGHPGDPGSRPAPGIVAIDSIQTIWTGALEAAPGTIAQVRTACSNWSAMPKRRVRRCC